MDPLIPLRPSLMVGITVVARYFLGSLLIMGLGAVYIPQGEYDQYVVSHSYAVHSLVGWVGIVICAAVGYLCVNRLIQRRGRRRYGGESVLSKTWLEKKENIERITWLCVTAGLMQLIFIGIAVFTCSEDRGDIYDYWAIQAWKPTSFFISVERLFCIFYIIIPVAFVKSCLRRKILLICLYSVLTVMSFSVSGRGAFLYPLLYTVVGMAAVVRKEVFVRLIVCFALLVAVLVPAMAAIRDLPSYGGYGSTSMLERALLYVKPSSYGENMRTRIFALGREVYACSDGFIYRDSSSKRYGFADIGVKEVARLALPRFLGGNKEKMDGSRIAKEYMGVKRKTWFPCITLQGDLFRRGGAIAIAIGGILYGASLCLLDFCWLKISRGNRIFNIVLTLLPITLLKAAPTGTTREVISFVFYELTKYVAVAWGLTFLESRICRWKAKPE